MTSYLDTLTLLIVENKLDVDKAREMALKHYGARGRAIDEAMTKHGGKVRKAAEELGIGQSTVYRHLRRKRTRGGTV